MKKIGIVICNYNKAEMVLECIKCILESKFTDYDLYVVDNASSDNSVTAIREKYADDVTLIVNSENLGGTGGFNTGLKIAYEKGYEYLMCVDNDAYLDENAISELYKFLEEHKECGMAASKVYHMEEPGFIQQYGQKIDFERFCTSVPDLNVYDDGSLPEYKYVDSVAACSLMVRRSTIDKIGFMSDEFFLYWDDTDWCYRCWLAGMSVASVGTSLVLHQMGAKKEAVNTFPTYYAWRNWIKFFIKYTDKEEWPKMAKSFLGAIFEVVYENQHKREYNLTKTVMLAYDDAIHGVVGKAGENRIFPVDVNYDKFVELFKKYDYLYLEPGEYDFMADTIREICEKLNATTQFVESIEKADKVVKFCETIFRVQDLSLENIYIDMDLCVLETNQDALDVINYGSCKRMFIQSQLPVFLQCIEENNLHS